MEKLKLEVDNIFQKAAKGSYTTLMGSPKWNLIRWDIQKVIDQHLTNQSNEQKDAGENCFFRGGHGCGNIRLDVPWKNQRSCVIMEQGKVYVKTVYSRQHTREPNISEYDSVEDAQTFIDGCLKWGIGIVSCEIISEESEMSKEVQNGNVIR